MKTFEGNLRINCSTEKSYEVDRSRGLAAIFKKIIKKEKPSIIFSETAEEIVAKLYRYDRLSMRKKKFSTYDVIGHMVCSHIGYSLKALKKISFFRMA